MNDIVIETRNLDKKFQRDGFSITALANIDLAVRREEFVALMGPS